MMTVSEAISKWLGDNQGILAETTLDWYAKRTRPLRKIGDQPIDQVTGDDLIQLWKGLARRRVRYNDAPQKPMQSGGLSVYTLFGTVIAWRRLFNWCVKSGYLKTSPAAQLRKPPLPDEPPKAISRKDVGKMLRQSRKTLYPKRDEAIVRFLVDTGCRVCGIVGLQVRDLDLLSGRAVVREKGRGGRHKARTVYIGRETIRALRAYLKERGMEAGPVFLGMKGKGQLVESGVYQLLDRLAQRAHVGIHNPHSFRHGFARGLLDNGADLSTVSNLLGHQDILVTARFYSRWDDKELKRKHAKFSWSPK